jgi:hypothetical protein
MSPVLAGGGQGQTELTATGIGFEGAWSIGPEVLRRSVDPVCEIENQLVHSISDETGRLDYVLPTGVSVACSTSR